MTIEQVEKLIGLARLQDGQNRATINAMDAMLTLFKEQAKTFKHHTHTVETEELRLPAVGMPWTLIHKNETNLPSKEER